MLEKIPAICVKISDLAFNIDYIAGSLNQGFLEENKSLPFQERIFRAFPELADRIHPGMGVYDIHYAVKGLFETKYRIEYPLMSEKVKEVQDKLNKVIVPALLVLFREFDLSYGKDFGDITCYLGLYSVFPRKVLNKEFWLHYLTRDENIFKAAMHEINHFVLFEKWKSMHGCKEQREPEHPEPLWFLEELIVDPTLNTKELQAFVPYPQRAYEQFYTAVVNGRTPQEFVQSCYRNSNTIEEFLEKTYRYIEDNLQELIEKCG
ncbi:hypothetical protein SAMN02745136_00847 [Anaerocolumna jejuensis DSM 15929]|uniref:Uncharacterized protein n=1 Tax=Anaerocolumna jejuensis DSM 15929 TaxID=1121322 RepID=A0A1M6M509_9FIRM|nr:hypothetical protein [Anaerocolumna jejuensis]SHJ78554.1 hypothetical protein SAMN02745136_00847 [Anaerocolumna jejuensis DSM 15929]